MSAREYLSSALAVAIVLGATVSASGQQIAVGTPMINVGDRFVESFGLGFAFGFPGAGFSGGGVSSDVGPSRVVGFNQFPIAWPSGGFGAFDSGAGATFGWGFRGDGFIGSFNLAAAQGSSRNLSSTAGSLTVTNGVPGFFAATTQRPFVTGLIPVVGDYGGGIAPVFGPAALMPIAINRTGVVRERINRLKAGERRAPGAAPISGAPSRNHNQAQVAGVEGDGFRKRLRIAQGSTAGRADASVAEGLRDRKATERDADDELTELRRKASAAEAAGKPHVARIYQQQIDRRSANGSEARKR